MAEVNDAKDSTAEGKTAYEQSWEYQASEQFGPEVAVTDDAPVIAPTPNVQLPETPVKHTHSKRLRAEAEDLGFSNEVIDGTPSEDLEVMIYRENRRQATQRVPHNPEVENASALPVKQQEEEDVLAGLDPDDLGADGADHPWVKAIKKLTKQLEQLKGRTGAIEQHTARQAHESQAQFIDRLFSETNRPELFGKGGVSEIGKGSQEMKRRNAVLAIASQGDPNIPIQKRFAQAVADLYPSAAMPEFPKPATDAEKQELANRAAAYSNVTAKPTNREAPPLPDGRKKAIKAVSEMLGYPAESEQDVW